MATEVLMPALLPTMKEGTMTKWPVKEGETVNASANFAGTSPISDVDELRSDINAEEAV